jgi:hypothetical protein
MRPFVAMAWRRTAASCFARLDSNARPCHSGPAAVADHPNFLKSKYPDVPLSKSTYFDFLWMNSQKNAGRTALVRTVLTYLVNVLYVHM